MFEQMIAAMKQPATQNGLDHAQRMIECTLRLTQTQMDVMKALYKDVGQEFSKTIASSTDQSAMARNWFQLMSGAARANAEAGVLLMQNAKTYQSELMQMMQMMQNMRSDFSGLGEEDMTGMAKTGVNDGSALKAARARKAA
jgi:hypothetical protein